MKVCPFCGAKIPEESIYCLNCSSVLNERQSFPVVKVKDKKKKAIAFIPRKRLMGIIAIVLSVVIMLSSCIFAIKSTRNNRANIEKPETTLAPVTEENGESVTNEKGEQVFEVIEVTDTTTEKQGLLDKLFGKDETEKSDTSSETTTKKPSILDKLFGDETNTSPTTTTTTEPEATTSTTTTMESTTNKTETTTTTTETTTTLNEKYSFEYTIESDGYVTITGYSGNASVVTIPAKIEDKCVTEIAKGAIANNNKITKVIFESRKKHIDLYETSFFNLSSLTTIDMGGGYYTIWGHFAADCPVKELINISKYHTFYNGGLYSNNELIYFCENPCYSEINIPEWSVGIKNGYSLKYNDNVKVINAHKNITSMPQTYLYYNEALTAINIEPGNSRYISKDGVFFYKANSSQTRYFYSIYPYSKKDKTFVIPENCNLCTRSSSLITNPYLETLYIPSSSALEHSDSSWCYNTAFKSLKSIYIAEGHSQYDKIYKTFTGNIYKY